MATPHSDGAHITYSPATGDGAKRVVPPESPTVMRAASLTGIDTGADGQPSDAIGITWQCCDPQHQDGVNRPGQIQHPGFFIYYCAPNSLKAAWTSLTHLI